MMKKQKKIKKTKPKEEGRLILNQLTLRFLKKQKTLYGFFRFFILFSLPIRFTKFGFFSFLPSFDDDDDE